MNKRSSTLVAVGITLLVIMIIASMGIVIVKPGSVKIEQCFGRLTEKVFDEGMSYQAPWCGVTKYSTRIISYETGDNPKDSDANYTDFTIDAQTSDGQQIRIKYTVLFRIDKNNAMSIKRDLGTMDDVVENVIKAYSRSMARTNAQIFQAETLYSGDIQQYVDAVFVELSAACAENHIELVEFLPRKIVFDADYMQSIELQQIEEENILTQELKAQGAVFLKEQAIQEAQGLAQAEREMAEARADNLVLMAQAEADSQILMAEAEATAISLRGEALEKYPQVLQLNFIDQLDNVDFAFLPSDNLNMFIPTPTP